MKIIEALKSRRSYYALDDKLSIAEEEIIRMVEQVTELVPDAFNMKSQRVVLALGDKHKQLWDAVYDAFGGNVDKAKTDRFKAGAGTILFLYDKKTLQRLQAQYPIYAHNFEPWALQANGMLQINIWTALKELGLGASLQHFNPIIDEKARELLDFDENYVLLAQMVFGNILQEPAAKEAEDIASRVSVAR